ncbi:D-alanyl-D-alanine carboxypeptidase [Halobacillus andaensis]|uniref:D-alanyl-D-alanine carboxypeptidase n=2 Tax=Halobacillus andaensis TaxID=1176239 RepID=A0A917B283_HALAA|nr:LAS superfamily LD-carboxypeptidase LdcB [Halobacillus andaensis]GGF16214.1 D-alanyl-D-alanine carboxypeptidase [Halobacillus andaensis]
MMRVRPTILLLSLSLSLTACSLDEWTNQTNDPSEEEPSSEEQQVEEEENKTNEEENESSEEESEEQHEDANPNAYANELDEVVDEDGLTIIEQPDLIEVVVNKSRKLPEGYEPEELVKPDVRFPFEEDLPKKYMQPEAAAALEELFAAANEEGMRLYATSGYRSYETQEQIYESNVAEKGQEEADKFSARPGTSEHQTGLAMDVTTAEMEFKLQQSFIDTKEGKWLADHAHEYGFVVRYLEGTSDITGYEYEPWHLRYVGKDLSTDIHESGGTLEEFFGFHPE